MQKEVTQCERTGIEGGRFGAHFGVLAKGRWLHDIHIYILHLHFCKEYSSLGLQPQIVNVK